MFRLTVAGLVLLALVTAPAAVFGQQQKRRSNLTVPPPGTVRNALADDALRGHIVDIQQALDRILAETTPAPVGTSGAARTTATDTPAGSSTAVTVERARLLELRRQLDALLEKVNKR
jgi:hypothetical protein